MIPVMIITGFLGCGKTSFLQSFLPKIQEKNINIALIVNEVGDANIDGELLKGINVDQISLMGGCVCCTLQANLLYELWNIIDTKKYDMIIIECSGISNPIDVVTTISTPAIMKDIYLSNIICLLDSKFARNVLDYSMIGKIQLDSANKVIINKTDLIDDAALLDITKEIRNINDTCDIYNGTYGNPGEDVLEDWLNNITEFTKELNKKNEKTFKYTSTFCTEIVKLPNKVNKEKLANALNSLPENVIRGKGFVKCEDDKWYSVQKAYETIDIREFDFPVSSSNSLMVFIGPRIWGKEIKKIMKTMLA